MGGAVMSGAPSATPQYPLLPNTELAPQSRTLRYSAAPTPIDSSPSLTSVLKFRHNGLQGRIQRRSEDGNSLNSTRHISRGDSLKLSLDTLSGGEHFIGVCAHHHTHCAQIRLQTCLKGIFEPIQLYFLVSNLFQRFQCRLPITS